MLALIHRLAAALATLCVACFLFCTLAAEVFGPPAAVAAVKAAIVVPGLGILVSAMALAGASGMALARRRGGRLAADKRRRMPLIAANGLLVLVPCAIVLARWSAAGVADAGYMAVQAVELLAGGTNLVLLLANVRDGRRMTRRTPPAPRVGTS